MKRRKLLSLLLAVALCVGVCIVPAEAAENQSYFARKGIPLMKELPRGENSALEAQYVVWNKADPSLYRNDYGVFWVDSCDVAPAEKPGYKTVTLTVKFAGRVTVVDDVEYFLISWSNNVFDYYTGRDFDRPVIWGGEEASTEYTVMYNGSLWPVTYTVNLDWEFDSWYNDGDLVQPGFCTQVNTFVVPENYDGLVYALYDTEKPALDEGEFVQTVSYASAREDMQCFRFGTEKPDQTEENRSGYLTREGINVLLTEASLTDVGVFYWMELTNTTDKPIQGAYGMLFYQPGLVTDYGLGAFFVFFDLDLDPGETVKIGRNSMWWGLTDSSLLWLSFDSAAERESFVSSGPIIDNRAPGAPVGGDYDFNYYCISSRDGGLEFLKDTFGLTP